jgi:hypothetical protein
MSDQPGNRIPTSPTPTFQSSDLKEAAQVDNGLRPWVSQPGNPEAFTIEPGEHFKKQASLPARKKLHSDEGTLTTITGGDN